MKPPYFAISATMYSQLLKITNIFLCTHFDKNDFYDTLN